ncbi:MAG: HI0074 family nucleotidyltransferase substrate-binding subunit [Anditalea sp.]
MKHPVKTCEKCLGDFKAALSELKELIEEVHHINHNEKVEQKLIRAFELVHELALSTMSEYFRQQGRPPYSGPRDITVDAFHEELIDDGEGWLDMIIIRIKTTPIYDEDTTKPLVQKIISPYVQLFENFNRKMEKKLEGNE